MEEDTHTRNMRQFEQIMETMFTCRSVVKYNMTMSEEQKKELVGDIDNALDILRSHFIRGTSASSVHLNGSIDSVEVQTSPLPPPAGKGGSSTRSSGPVSTQEKSAQQTLQALYKMYHAYLYMNQRGNANTVVNRFNEAMSTISEVQRVIDNQPAYMLYHQSSSADELLQEVRLFIADLYYMFMEFLRMLSAILQKNDVQLDTEKLASLENERMFHAKQQIQRDLLPLSGVYAAHQQLNQTKGHIAVRIRESSAFLEFLKESLDTRINKRDELIAQLNNVSRILYDMGHLLTNYEQATSMLLFIQ